MIGRPLGTLLDRCDALHANAPALVVGDRALSYREVFGSIRATGRGLRRLGLREGDRVAILMGDRPELLWVYFGAIWAGLAVVPLNARLGVEDHAYILEDSGARALAYDAATAERAHELLARGGVELAVSADAGALEPGGHDLHALAEHESGAPGCPEVDVETPCLIPYTGGTTGRPKGVVHSHRTFAAALLSELLEAELGDGEVFAHVAPLTHASGLFALPVWLRGGTNVVLGGFDPARLLDAIERHRVTSTLLVPTMLYVLLDAPGVGDRDLSSLRTVVYGAAPIGEQRLREAIELAGPVFTQLYGQTEAPNQLTVLRKRDHERALAGEPQLLGSCGRPVTIADLRIADDELVELGRGEVGEIVARGPHVMHGYLNKPEETAEALRDGWLRTGDLARMDEEGFVYIVDRKKDMIVTGGLNVYPKEIEQVLFEHPAVRDVAVVGVPDEKWGEAVKAVVVAADGTDVAPGELVEWVKRRKDSVHAPKSVELVDAIPLTAVGKHDKQALRATYWKDRGRAVN